MDRIPKQGEFYRHFKNKLYQITAIAVHSETGEQMVVYQALYGDYKIYVRPLSMFVGETDHEKYPDAGQHYRFERVIPTADGNWEGEGQPSSCLLDFLEEETLDGKMEILGRMKGHVGQKELDSLYVVLDIKPVDGTVEEQLDGMRSCLAMQNKFDGRRLR